MATAKEKVLAEIANRPNERSFEVDLGDVWPDEASQALLAAIGKGYRVKHDQRGKHTILTLTKR